MKKVSKCLVCGSSNLYKRKSKLTDFVCSRTHKSIDPPTLTKICLCDDCSFGFYEDRLSDEENGLLYKGYRDAAYQQLREKCEPWYTKEVNDGLNDDTVALSEQKRIIISILNRYVKKEIKVALDYGGNEGRTFTDPIGTEERYVYDISGIPTVDGVKGIATEEELKKHHYDFIMCNHLFEHLSYPVDTLKHLKEISSDDTYYYIEVPSESPFMNKVEKRISWIPDRLYVSLADFYHSLIGKPTYFHPMHEHVNFFTIDSMRTMLEKNGFKVICIEENEEKTVLGKPTVLSALFVKANN